MYVQMNRRMTNVCCVIAQTGIFSRCGANKRINRMMCFHEENDISIVIIRLVRFRTRVAKVAGDEEAVFSSVFTTFE